MDKYYCGQVMLVCGDRRYIQVKSCWRLEWTEFCNTKNKWVENDFVPIPSFSFSKLYSNFKVVSNVIYFIQLWFILNYSDCQLLLYVIQIISLNLRTKTCSLIFIYQKNDRQNNIYDWAWKMYSYEKCFDLWIW